jgi:simple sugar transport system ATP-binding protein
LVLAFPVRDNLVLCTYYAPPFARGIEINEQAIETDAQKLVGEFDIRTPSTGTTVGSLSGGNQQKVIVARELNRPVKLLIVNQPTRGLDVGSIEFIHRRIVEARDRRTAVLLVSAELDEIMSLSDRIAVMYKGRILDTLDAKDASREQLGLLMAGVKGGAHV